MKSLRSPPDGERRRAFCSRYHFLLMDGLESICLLMENKGTDMSDMKFFKRVYEIVARIPEGRVATYGQIALMAGSPYASRVVGYAMSRVRPEQDLPCHRVVNREGRMAPGHVFGGQGIQRAMLEREGITFLGNGCIDMKRHLWGRE